MKSNTIIRNDAISSPKRKESPTRKRGMNRHKKGSVRNINGAVYVDFYYMEERVRENTRLPWSEKNSALARKQLDRIHSAIELGTFRFAEVFPYSRKKYYFQKKEQETMGIELQPNQVSCGEFIQEWYELLRDSGRVTERTLLGYNDLIRNYLKPFFGPLSFEELNLLVFDKFFSWARKQKLRGYTVSNATLNKCMTVLKMVCKGAVHHYKWGNQFHPFLDYKKLSVDDPYHKVRPFSLQEQERLIAVLPDHWKPYFKFAFSTGLRQGEQIGLKSKDIDWEKGALHIKRAMTRDESGRPIEGKTKNQYSRRTIKLLPVMRDALREQKRIHERLDSPEYFFCTPRGARIHPSNFRRKVWLPALKQADLKIRDMRQTRHSFATNALSCGENPLWIASVLGHRNTEMIIKVYSKYIERSSGSSDGKTFNDLYQGNNSNDGEPFFGQNLGKTG